MRRLIIILCTTIIALSLISCDTSTDAEPELVESQMAPSEELSTMINETPSDFTWGYFQDNINLSMLHNGPTPHPYYLVLHSFQVNNGEVANRNNTEPVEVLADKLSSGVVTEEIPPSLWMPGSDWVSTSDWQPKSTFIQMTDPLVIQQTEPLVYHEVENMVLNNVDLGTDETMVVVYASFIAEDEREMTVQAFGIIFEHTG